jgi:pimeloyl-ACP methyl ester carboxylesterase
MFEPETRRVRTRAGDLTVDLWGRPGRTLPILLLHGIPGWRGTWREVASRLAPAHLVAAPDLAGFGDSDDAPRGAHAREHAEALADLVEALGFEDFHVAGFDFGGPVAVCLAARAPRRVRSLVLAATNLFPDTPVPPPLRVARVPVLGDLAFRLAFGRIGLLALWRAACGDRAAYPLSRHRAALASGRGVVSTRRIFLASLRDLDELYAPVARAAEGLRIPAAVLWGDRDPFFPVAVGERTARALDARLRVLAGCGHFVPEERAEETARVIHETVAVAEDRGAAAPP